MSSENTAFNDYSSVYDAFYADKDYAAEVAYVQKILVQNGIQSGTILEFGSGTGIHGRLLGDLGYEVHGVERSIDMVRRAEQTANFTCQHGDIREVQLGKRFDAVLSLFHVVSYQVTNADIESVFERAADHLRVDGLFVFDIWYTPAVYNLKPSVRIKRASDEERELTRIAEPTILPNENRVDVNYEVLIADRSSGRFRRFVETHAMRHFSLPELDYVSAKFGFERIAAEEFLSGDKPSERTWGVCVILRKTG